MLPEKDVLVHACGVLGFGARFPLARPDRLETAWHLLGSLVQADPEPADAREKLDDLQGFLSFAGFGHTSESSVSTSERYTLVTARSTDDWTYLCTGPIILPSIWRTIQ